MAIPSAAVLRQNLRAAIDRSSFRSDNAVAKASDISASQLHAMLNGEMKHGPGALMLARTAGALGVGVDQLLGLQSAGRPSFNDLIEKWARDSKTLAALDYAADFFDVYHAPEPTSTRMRAYRIGGKSLASQSVGVPFRKAIQTLIDRFTDEEKQRAVMADYRSAFESGVHVSLQELHVPAIGRLRAPLDLKYQRLLLGCRGPENEKLVVNYAIPLE